MNYQVRWNDPFVEHDIWETEEDADGIMIFKSFTEAKSKLISLLSASKNEIHKRIVHYRQMKKKDCF